MACFVLPQIWQLLKICCHPLSGVAKTTGPESGNDGFDKFRRAGNQVAGQHSRSQAPPDCHACG